ncbi:MAG TPA: efflux transporter outer membrane subunit [Acidobacteriaceae bacterium]|nr:efflux transporter outer membrane subunit [Acidobacteriaceae bacterium]
MRGARVVKRVFLWTGTAVLMLGGGCLAPKYQRPSVPVAPAYKEAGDTAIWKPAQPADDRIRRNWWEMYGDPELNVLEAQVDSQNLSVAAAAAQYDAARAVVRQTRAQYFPTLSTAPAATNARIAALPYAQAANGTTYTNYSFPVTASWEPDFWGRVRNSVRGSAYAAQASAADLENVKLLAHANLAADYFDLRGVEAQKRVLDATVASWQSYLELTQDLCKSGLSNDEALAAAESQLKAAQAQDTNLGIARAQYEHAIAILVGRAPSMFSIGAETHAAKLPEIPAEVPSELLERRPDIAGAERAVAQANAEIGVARSAWFPNVMLSGTAGIESLTFADWFTWPSRFWSVGPEVAETVFDAGARSAAVQQARALDEAAAANYRLTALGAFQQVEDSLAAQRVLAVDLEQQASAVESARRFLAQALARNRAGLDPFLNVLVAQMSVQNYQLTWESYRTQQLVTSVQLIEALGGGWDASEMPPAGAMRSSRPPTAGSKAQGNGN